jgi:hypothetical protein
MDKKRFEADLESISPRRLILDGKDEFDNFFLVLALIFNDLKGTVFFGVSLESVYEEPEPGVSAHAGEFGGIRVHQYKLLASLIREFLAFIKKNEAIIQSPKFILLLMRIPVGVQNYWTELVDIALTNQVEEKTSFAHSLRLIRDNVGFHFDQAHKNLKDGFVHFFYEMENGEISDRAYYALGSTMRDTRFYYIDAAVQGYIYKKAEELTTKDGEPSTFEEHHEQLRKTVDQINETLKAILEQYLSYAKVKKM